MKAPAGPRVAILTYSTRPRGGVIHALRLTEELHRLGVRVHLFALGDPAVGFFRDVAAPHTIVRAPEPAPTLEERVFASLEALEQALATEATGFDIAHAEDCISARAAVAIRDRGAAWVVVRTVHHVDDFTTKVLVECQRRSILEPDAVCVVSEFWRGVLREEYGIEAIAVTNGVDADRFVRPDGFDPTELKERVGARERFLFLTVGGIEPRKGSMELIEAMAKLKAAVDAAPVLAVVGGHSFQDYARYRSDVFDRAAALGLEMGRDVVLLGTVPDAGLPAWYWAADAFVFPSVREGWGLVVLEALAAGLPVVATDLPVFREYLTDERDAMLVRPRNAELLAGVMRRIVSDSELRGRLSARGPGVARRFSWVRSARAHAQLYRRVWAGTRSPSP